MQGHAVARLDWGGGNKRFENDELACKEGKRGSRMGKEIWEVDTNDAGQEGDLHNVAHGLERRSPASTGIFLNVN